MTSTAIYCVYLTIYRGNKMPPFYIGSTSEKQINLGYRGSVASKQYKDVWISELQENPHLFDTRIVSRHQTRKEAIDREYDLQTKLNVIRNSLYINKSTARKNGFFGRDVSGENNPMYGKSRRGEKHNNGKNISKGLKRFFETDLGKEEKIKRSQRFSGEGNGMYGKTFSPEIIQKMKDTRKGSDNGMFGRKHSEESKRKMSENRKKKRLERLAAAEG